MHKIGERQIPFSLAFHTKPPLPLTLDGVFILLLLLHYKFSSASAKLIYQIVLKLIRIQMELMVILIFKGLDRGLLLPPV